MEKGSRLPFIGRAAASMRGAGEPNPCKSRSVFRRLRNGLTGGGRNERTSENGGMSLAGVETSAGRLENLCLKGETRESHNGLLYDQSL